MKRFWLLCMHVIFSCVFIHTANAANSAQKSLAHDKPQTPLRVITLAPHLVEMLFDIGAGDLIVGTVDYSDFPEAAKDIPRIGGYYGLQLEKILMLQPDIILAWQSGNKQADLEQLERLGLNIIYSKPNQIIDVAHELRHFGKVLGKSAQAEKVAKAFEQRLQLLTQRYQNKPPVQVFYQLWSNPMMTINQHTWLHQLLTICQGRNVFANNVTEYPHISIENVVVAQPEIIIIPNEKSAQKQPEIDWQKWPEIPAVKANAFIAVNADLLHRFSTRMLDGVESMCNKIDDVRSALTDHQ